jgi:two-component system sensor histidine kinase TctE
MFWKFVRELSLKVRLLVILIPVLTAFSTASLFYAREDVIRSTNAAYDRSLLGVIKSINLNVSNTSGGLSVELPYKLFEFFELTASGNVYFKVSTPDGLVQVGNHDLPSPPVRLLPGQPIFYDAIYFDQPVRVGAYLHSESAEKNINEVSEWVIQVAEGVQSREFFATSLVQRAMLRESLMVLLIWLGVGLGLAYGLKPLIHLVKQVGNRQSVDLAPLPQHGIPSELQPLIVAINYQLQRTDKLMAERRSFIDDASHQLRTYLSVLQMQIDFGLRESNSTVRYEVLISLSNELTHAIRGINQLLSLAKSDAAAIEMVSFDLAGSVRNVVLSLLPLAKERSIDLGIHLNNDVLAAQGDSYLISQALSNIVHNAIQHGRHGGVVTVSASIEDALFVITVLDDGPGISEDVMRRIGERFAKGKTSRGSGLGLAIARSVMASHNGELTVHLLVNNSGTEVCLIWPKS